MKKHTREIYYKEYPTTSYAWEWILGLAVIFGTLIIGALK